MKIVLMIVAFISISLNANDKWIKIKSPHKSEAPKPTPNLDINLSQIKPADKMIKNATAIKKLIDARSKKEKTSTNAKNWFILDAYDSK
ncbi:hypothetical protein GJV85_06165 [Sulfurimonas aquatica]|uniref:Uncharacterized protein n=1 Tax=Sulfurimonas aquatica TaxID=2672570 RepID=A0A975GCN8_9BACT|nr:hypothetical protein [Sulfurimonas aquatica]QSZ41707.1 hypothetical protein GJV85_06165 [Sulfurimonas aquatica]